jgi:hypothetical protein
VRLQKIINSIFLYSKMKKELNWYMERMWKLYSFL